MLRSTYWFAKLEVAIKVPLTFVLFKLNRLVPIWHSLLIDIAAAQIALCTVLANHYVELCVVDQLKVLISY